METFTIIPTVDATQEFIEISNDFSNPLDLIREAISNSYDAEANEIKITYQVITEYGEKILKIIIEDNGVGMDKEGLQSFFDLGNSLRRGKTGFIGTKGHGTKVYFNSNKIEVTTWKNGHKYHAVMNKPIKSLFDRKIPQTEVEKEPSSEHNSGTKIEIYGYNNNRRDKFTHEILRDYVIWFSAHGSVEKIINKTTSDVMLFLQGLGRDKPEMIERGHYFPADSVNMNQLFEKYIAKAPDYYSKKIVKKGHLKNFPEISYEAVFCIEGKCTKYEYNKMLRRRGYQAPEGAYTIQERYGLWLCKDFIPIQRKNEWIAYKGSEYTKFHAFFNCQDLRLTANRSSIDNTPSEIIQDIKEEVRKIYDAIINGDDWRDIEWLENETSSYQTVENEKKNFAWRIKKINRANVAQYKNITLVEPERESGVFSLFLILATLSPELFPFQIIDYDTHEGIDVVAKGDKTTPIADAKLYYVEFKNNLEKNFNHSFVNLHSIVCWETSIKHDDILVDINNEERKMIISRSESKNDYAHYYLDHPSKAHKIEIFVLKHYLKEKLNLEFNPRTKDVII